MTKGSSKMVEHMFGLHHKNTGMVVLKIGLYHGSSKVVKLEVGLYHGYPGSEQEVC